jgi:microcompartment protein CcmL/EutN
MNDSIGLIESKGLVALIEALDVLLKNSPVKIIGIKKLQNGLVTLAINGDVEHLKSAMQTAVNAGDRVGEIYAHTIIEKPNELVVKFVKDFFTNEIDEPISLEEKIKPKLKSDTNKHVPEFKKSELKKNEKESVEKHLIEEDKTPIVQVQNEIQSPEIISKSSTIARLRKEALGNSSKKVLEEKSKKEIKKEEHSVSKTNSEIDFDYIENLNVHKLRRFARGFENFPIKGRQISKANRDELINFFRTLK